VSFAQIVGQALIREMRYSKLLGLVIGNLWRYFFCIYRESNWRR